MEPKLDYLVMDDTNNNVDFEELAAFEASLSPEMLQQIKQESDQLIKQWLAESDIVHDAA